MNRGFHLIGIRDGADIKPIEMFLFIVVRYRGGVRLNL